VGAGHDLLRSRSCAALSDSTPASSASEPGEFGSGEEARLRLRRSLPLLAGGWGEVARSGDSAPLVMRLRPADSVSAISFWKPLTPVLSCCFASALLCSTPSVFALEAARSSSSPLAMSALALSKAASKPSNLLHHGEVFGLFW
jgi:hypothetical protein